MADFGSNNAWQERGHWWRADETNLLFISSAGATSAFSKTDFWTAHRYCAAISQASRTFLSDSETGHKYRIHLPDTLMDFKLKGSQGRLFFCPNSMAFCTNMLRGIPIFHPVHLCVTALLHLPLHGKNGLGCK